jgi:putative membrane protein
MKRALIVAGACVFLAASAIAQTPAPQGTTPSPAPAPAAQPAAPPPASATTSTADFVQNAAIAGLFEIESSRLALRKHIAADRQFAERMIHDHTRIGAQLKRLVRHGHVNVTIPAKLDADHQKMLDQLKGESGDQFAKDYAQMQQQGHEQAVSLFQNYSQSGDNPALKQWAGKTLPTLQMHLQMAQKLAS